jgi:hypothetical protein
VKTTLEIELTRQISRPGDEIAGTVHLAAEGKIRARELTVSLQGEETVGANSINRSIIIPLVNEQRSFPLEKNAGDGETPQGSDNPQECLSSHDRFCSPFTFKLPENIPPSYASDIFKCLYFVKARLDIPWGRDMIEKMHITVVPYEPISQESRPVEISLERENLKIKVDLERDSLFAGDSLAGTFYLEHIAEEAPRLVNFELRAEEHSLEESYSFSRVQWSLTKDVPLKDFETGYTMARFEFPTPADAPFSFKWNSFEVFWEFLVTITTFDDEEVKISRPILIKRMI